MGRSCPGTPSPKRFGPLSMRRESLGQGLWPPNTGGGKEAKNLAGAEPEGGAATSGALGQRVECHLGPQPPSAVEIHWVIRSPALPAYLTGLL